MLPSVLKKFHDNYSTRTKSEIPILRFLFIRHRMLRRLGSASSPSFTHLTRRTMSTSADYYVAVQQDGSPSTSSASVASELPQLWKTSRASDKAGETRTFYGVGGDKTVVAVGLGKGAAKSEDALKEQARKTVSFTILYCFQNLLGPYS